MYNVVKQEAPDRWVKEEKAKKRVFQQPFGYRNTSDKARNRDQDVPIRAFGC